ncbi:MAG: ABC transporter ATP-binding protein [Epsilonproteobacteria bacterium]|nr:MAG: ABC transporter ATP-binding protein [Campylobacterota bacterium]
MNYLTIENVTKTYGEKVLFENITLHINQGDKMALVAKNGTGKTTLLRLIAGEETGEGEQSKVLVHKNIRIGYLKQDPQFNPNQTVIEAVFDTENEVVAAIMAYETAMLHPENHDALQTALVRMEDLKAWDFESKIKEILFKLNITNLEQKVAFLSGGQVKRLALARLLIDEPDFLILDEPTNHLDLDMIEWLEEYLRQPKLTLFIVTHDRYFLERVCNYIVELDRGALYKYSGNYSDFLIKKTTRHGNEAIETSKAQKLMRKELEWIRRAPKARGTKAKSRVDAFEVIKDKATNKLDNEKVQIEIKGARLGNKILELNYISKAYDDLNLIEDFHYKFKRNERVGIVGNNGTGKTTFLKLITKEIRPDSGTVVVGGTVKFGHYTQDGISLKEDKRVIDVITDIAEYIPLEKGQKLTARMLLERFMFSPSHQQVYVSQLSGGERRRLYLLTVLMENPNFLILDEPTNDLDIITLNVLEEFLLQFPGCVVIVSHDRYFMDKLVDHLFIFEGDGKVKDYNGNYTEYRRLNKKTSTRSGPSAIKQAPGEKSAQTEAPQQPSKQAQKGLTFEQRKELKRVENQIKKLEARKSEIESKFNNPDLLADDIQTLSSELGEINSSIEEKELRWFELSELAEQ